ncbi:formylglycine-generating enzyme family protein [Puteibacter caeruleilacunae]|nr:formylglycine-generating enzyme family protein [Puteibacter caeruleilacunae]
MYLKFRITRVWALALCLVAGFASLNAQADDAKKKEEAAKKYFYHFVNQLEDKSFYEAKAKDLSCFNCEKATNLLNEIREVLHVQQELDIVSFEGAERSLKNIIENFPQQKASAEKYLAKLKEYKNSIPSLKPAIYKHDEAAIAKIRSFVAEHRKAMLDNPLLKGKEILAVRHVVNNSRRAMARQIGRVGNNWTTNANMSRKGFNNQIVKLSNVCDDASYAELYKTHKGQPVKDVDLHWNGDRMLFSTVNDKGRWHVYEMNIDGSNVTQITPDNKEDVDYFDACYLPDGRIVLSSTASYTAVPCISGNGHATDLYLLDPKTKDLRQLNFGQESEWNPIVLNNGKVCYLRWEYTDASHYFTRILMQMNPDGTSKKEYYGSGSYFPNSFFDAHPIPGHATEVIGIVSGHHGIARSGRLMIFDPTLGRREAEGAVQEIPGYGKKVKAIIKDRLVDGVWPQFLTPFPLDKNYFLVSAKMAPDALWGIYLVDRFDNMILVHEHEGEAFAEPIAIEKRPVPPVIPDKVNLEDKTSTVYITDIYEGLGLQGVKRGTVKKIRIFAYQYGYNKIGGHDYIGFESAWDVKRILGTVPVEEDGSAMFKIPANIPISLQPLDETGAALQVMRSWLTGMPGEVVSCVGCHESQNMVPPAKFTQASRKKPAEITNWYGPVRPVTYYNEVKPVIEKRCVACHNGTVKDRPNLADDSDSGYHGFSKSYMALHPFVRRPGCESDFLVLSPMDYYANTSELVQMLKKGHHGVELDAEEWDRLITWIDMNVPFRGKFETKEFNGYDQVERRRLHAKEYANVCVNPEAELVVADSIRAARGKIEPVMPTRKPKKEAKELKVKGWPLAEAAAKELQKKFAVNGSITKTVKLPNGQEVEFVRIPAGKFVIGDRTGQPDQTESIVEIEKPFWMSKTEITNEMFRSVMKKHDSRFIDQQWKDHIFAGYPANEDPMPAIRMSWNEATEFCQKLSKETGLKVSLPTEAQWEWAARAGSNSKMYFGGCDSDFSAYENLADYTMRDLAVIGVDPKPMGPKNGRFKYYNFVPKTEKYNDGILVPQGTAGYKPNPWGLYDMLGNVCEWTSTNYSYDGYKANAKSNLRVAKGGSWRDRPKFATAATRDGYLPYQRVFNVGVRLIIED